MKQFSVLILMTLCFLLLTACGCSHTWTEADCETPRICTICNETKGDPLGHSWQDAACETPKTCTRCSLTEGDALVHDWAEATCETPRTCVRCALTEGESLGHQWSKASCTEEKVCTVCNTATGEFGPHMDIEAIDKVAESDVWFICKCGQEETVSAEELMLRLLQGKWELRAVQKNGGMYLPDPDTNWQEGTWLEFPSSGEPLGYETGAADSVASFMIPQTLLDFKKTTAIMYTGGPEIPILTCSAQSDYGDNSYVRTPLILVIGDRDYQPEDYAVEDFLKASLNGTVLSLWRVHTDATYIYSYAAP